MASMKQMTRSQFVSTEPRACLLESVPSPPSNARRPAPASRSLVGVCSSGSKAGVNSTCRPFGPSPMCVPDKLTNHSSDVSTVSPTKELPIVSRHLRSSPDGAAACRQTARKSFPRVLNGSGVAQLQAFVLDTIRSVPCLEESGPAAESVPPKIKSLQTTLPSLPGNMADPKVPVVALDGAIQQALRRLTVTNLPNGGRVNRCHNFKIMRLNSGDSNPTTKSEVSSKRPVPDEPPTNENDDRSVEMPPLLCPSEIKREVLSEREMSSSPEMPVLYPVDKDGDELTPPKEERREAPTGPLLEKATTKSASPKRSVREAHFHGRYAYMVGKKVRDPSLPPRRYRKRSARLFGPPERPLTLLSPANRWPRPTNPERQFKAEAGGVRAATERRVLLKFVDSTGRLRYKEVSGQQLKSGVLQPVMPKKLGRPFGPGRRGRRGRPRLNRPRGLATLQRDPHVDVIDGLEFLSFETERDLEWFMRRHPSCTLDLSRLSDLDVRSVLLAAKQPMKEVTNEMDPPRSRLPGEPIVPTKTTDIRKIKGWRHKVFAAEALSAWGREPDDLDLSLNQRLVLLKNVARREVEKKGLSDRGSDCVWKGRFEKGVAGDDDLVAGDDGSVAGDDGLVAGDDGTERVDSSGVKVEKGGADDGDKSAFVSDFLDEFLRTNSELKVSTRLSAERKCSEPEAVDTKVVWPAREESPATCRRFSRPVMKRRLLKKRVRLRKKQLKPAAVKRVYRKLKRGGVDRRGKAANDGNAGAADDRLKRFVDIEAVVMSLTDAQFAVTALVSRSVWSGEGQALTMADLVGPRDEADVRPPPAPLKRADKRNSHVLTVPISSQLAYRAVSALATVYFTDQAKKPSPRVAAPPATDDVAALERYDVIKLDKENRRAVWPKAYEDLDVPSRGAPPTATSSSSSTCSEESPTVSKDGKCRRPFCRLGCVCDSLKTRKRRRKHCGKVECMFSCSCYDRPSQPAPIAAAPSPSGGKRRRQIRLPARLQDSAYLWNRGKESLIDSNTGVPLDKPRDAKSLKVLWDRSLDPLDVGESVAPPKRKKEVVRRRRGCVGRPRKTGNLTLPPPPTNRYPPVNVPSVFPTLTLASPVPVGNGGPAVNGVANPSPMLLMVDKHRASDPLKGGAGQPECHLLLNQDGSLVPCVLVPIQFDSGQLVPVAPASVANKRVAPTASAPVVQANSEPNASVDDAVKDVVMDLVNRVTLQLAIERFPVRGAASRHPSIRPKPPPPDLRTGSVPKPVDQKALVSDIKSRYAGLPHDWQSITKPLEESPEYCKNQGGANEMEIVKRAAQRRVVECNRRNAIRAGLKLITSLVSPFVRDPKRSKTQDLPVHYFVVDMAIEVIQQLQEFERELVGAKQNLIKERMELLRRYTESLKGMDAPKQKSALTELAGMIQDCCKERTQRRQSSQIMPPTVESLNLAVMTGSLSNDIVVDSLDSEPVENASDSDGSFSDISIFDSSDSEAAEDDALATLPPPNANHKLKAVLPMLGLTPASVTVSLPAEKASAPLAPKNGRDRVATASFPARTNTKPMKQYLTIQATKPILPKSSNGSVITVRSTDGGAGIASDKSGLKTLRLRAPGSSPVWIPLHAAASSFTTTSGSSGVDTASSKPEAFAGAPVTQVSGSFVRLVGTKVAEKPAVAIRNAKVATVDAKPGKSVIDLSKISRPRDYTTAQSKGVPATTVPMKPLSYGRQVFKPKPHITKAGGVVTISSVSRPNTVGPPNSTPCKIIPVTSRRSSDGEVTIVGKSTSWPEVVLPTGDSAIPLTFVSPPRPTNQNQPVGLIPNLLSRTTFPAESGARCSTGVCGTTSVVKPKRKPPLLGNDEITPIITLSLPSATGDGKKLLVMTPERAVPKTTALTTAPSETLIRNFVTSSGNVSLIALPRTDGPAAATASKSAVGSGSQQGANASSQELSDVRVIPLPVLPVEGKSSDSAVGPSRRNSRLQDFEDEWESGSDDDDDDDSDSDESDSDEAQHRDWFKIVALTSISEDEFRCKDGK